MNRIELNRRFPLSIVDSPLQPLVIFNYTFAPPVVEESEEDRTARTLTISSNGTSASLVTKIASQSQVEGSTSSGTEYCFSGTTTTSQTLSSDYILRISDTNESFQLLPTSAITGLKRDRKNEFVDVKDNVAKAARTSWKEKTRAISHARRKNTTAAQAQAPPVISSSPDSQTVAVSVKEDSTISVQENTKSATNPATEET